MNIRAFFDLINSSPSKQILHSEMASAIFLNKFTLANRWLTVDFGTLIWVPPSFWCKPNLLIFIMDEYQVAVC
jgi:hypothetical protein